MLFDSSTRKELSRSFGATLVVLVTVVMTMMLIRTLGQATKGNVNPSDVMLVMGFTVLGYLPTILTLSLFIAIVGTLSRMYRDSEMAIWYSSGQGLFAHIRPIVRFSWPIIATVALLSLLVWPWSNAQILELRTQFEQRSDIDRIAPGEFQESSDGSRVIFIDKDSLSETSASNLFIVERQNGKEVVTSAKSAHVEVEHGARHAVLTQGQRVETQDTSGALKVTQFERYSLRLDEGDAAQAELSTKAMSSYTLLQEASPHHLGELSWRLSQPLLAMNLMLVALAITIVNPRAGNSASLALALLAFVAYFNLVNVLQSWIGSQKTNLPVGMLLLHGSVLAVAALGVAMRHHRWSIKDLWQRRRKGKQA